MFTEITQDIENEITQHYFKILESRSSNQSLVEKILSSHSFVKHEIKNIAVNNIKIIKFNRPTHKELKGLFFCQGNTALLNKTKVSIIGSRLHSNIAYNSTKNISSVIANQFTVVSGLAAGIDSIAHKYAIKQQYKTIAVIGTGLKHKYPSSNSKLYLEIVKNGGLIISPFFFDTSPIPKNFLYRNQIIVSLSNACFVIESSPKSGTHNAVKSSFNKKIPIYTCNILGQNNSGNKILQTKYNTHEITDLKQINHIAQQLLVNSNNAK